MLGLRGSVIMHRHVFRGLVALLLLASACSKGSSTSSPTTGSPAITTPASTSSPTTSPTPLPPTRLASGEALPAECNPGSPQPTDTVAFAALGRAWTLSPSGDDLTCLFNVADPGPFVWGPLGDRVLLASLRVDGLPGAQSRQASDVEPGPSSWGHPTGKSVVFVSSDGDELDKVHMGNSTLDNVTPVPDATYLSVTYHPSGLAFAFALESEGEQSIWISSNVGQNPQRLVFSEEGTTFGALAFSLDGKSLYYAAQHSDDHPELHRITLTDTSKAPVVWHGAIGQGILDIWPGGDTKSFAFTQGKSCEEAVAMYSTSDVASPALPDETRPTRLLGWLDETSVLVAAGPCGGPMDLSSVNISNGEVVPLVIGVDAGAVRTPAPVPAPPLPEGIGGSGFA
jgi:hypothetical protein